MSRGKHVTEKVVDRVRLLNEAGLSDRKTAKALNISEVTVGKIRRSRFDIERYRETNKPNNEKQNDNKQSFVTITVQDFVDLLESVTMVLSEVQTMNKTIRVIKNNSESLSENMAGVITRMTSVVKNLSNHNVPQNGK